MSNTSYRIDRVTEVSNKCTDYRVPCGMNSIVYLGKVDPTYTYVLKSLPILKSTEIYLLSKWNEAKRDFIPYKLYIH